MKHISLFIFINLRFAKEFIHLNGTMLLLTRNLLASWPETCKFYKVLHIIQYILVLQIDVSEQESVFVNSSCNIGLTFTETEGPVAYMFDPNHQTLSRTITIENDIPLVGDIYTIDTVKQPYRFMIGLWVDTGMPIRYILYEM